MRVLVVVGICQFALAAAGELRVLAWNVESGDPSAEDPNNGSDPTTIARELQQFADYAVVGLSEVRPSAAKQFVDALSAGANETFLSVQSATGMDDRLLLAWRAKPLKLLAGYELHRYATSCSIPSTNAAIGATARRWSGILRIGTPARSSCAS
jgi:hypothetical protein